ncbi:hypothetical protein Tco_1050869 [Tanacetum coccineum]
MTSQTAPVRRVEDVVVEGSRKRGRPKLRWEDRLKHDMKELLLSEDMTSDRNARRDRIRISGNSLMHTYTGRRSPGSSLFTSGFILEVGVGFVYISPPSYPASAGLGMLLLLQIGVEMETLRLLSNV